ncbi:MAG TPA: class I SAM-dependent methyltransferase [Xanthobacteraceae bacterium]|nr:class I SAM-dependent methyltransferase [Xanthobacteraceae bacterium]
MIRTLMSIFTAVSLTLAGGTASMAQGTTDQPPPHAGAGDHPMSGATPGMHHSFGNAEEWAKQFDDPNRDAWQQPDKVLDALPLASNALVADLGAGTGYFSVRIAKRVPQGKVYAVDIEPDMLRYLEERKHQERLHVLQPVQASADAANLPEPVDLVLVVDTYHHIDNRTAYFAKLGQSLRPNGRLAIIDFKVDAPEGPPPEFRMPAEKVTAEIEAAGYRLVATHAFLPRQYFLVFQRKGPARP